MSSADYLTDIRFTPNGRYVVNADAIFIRIWDAETGDPVSPRYNASAGTLPSLDISADGRWALMSGAASQCAIIDLHKLTTPAEGSPEEVLRKAELMTSARVNGSSIVNLTATERLERWQQFRRTQPDFQPFDESARP
jgi:WD40 repeat protein